LKVMSEKSFSERVYELVKKIPRGKVSTYKLIAEALHTTAYRAVGQALKNNPNPVLIPCHRVVKSDGEVGGFKGEKFNAQKIWLLEKEGVRVINNRIINFKKKIYSFKKE